MAAEKPSFGAFVGNFAVSSFSAAGMNAILATVATLVTILGVIVTNGYSRHDGVAVLLSLIYAPIISGAVTLAGCFLWGLPVHLFLTRFKWRHWAVYSFAGLFPMAILFVPIVAIGMSGGAYFLLFLVSQGASAGFFFWRSYMRPAAAKQNAGLQEPGASSTSLG